MKNKRFNPKVGEVVSLYYDGKSSRRVTGAVIKRRGFWMDIAFIPWAAENNKASIIRVVRKDRISFFGYLRGKGEAGIMKMLGAKGDYYSVDGDFRNEKERWDEASEYISKHLKTNHVTANMVKITV